MDTGNVGERYTLVNVCFIYAYAFQIAVYDRRNYSVKILEAASRLKKLQNIDLSYK